MFENDVTDTEVFFRFQHDFVEFVTNAHVHCEDRKHVTEDEFDVSLVEQWSPSLLFILYLLFKSLKTRNKKLVNTSNKQ